MVERPKYVENTREAEGGKEKREIVMSMVLKNVSSESNFCCSSSCRTEEKGYEALQHLIQTFRVGGCLLGSSHTSGR
jgi:hypothetical protein